MSAITKTATKDCQINIAFLGVYPFHISPCMCSYFSSRSEADYSKRRGRAGQICAYNIKVTSYEHDLDEDVYHPIVQQRYESAQSINSLLSSMTRSCGFILLL